MKISYTQDYDGRWWKTVWEQQCNDEEISGDTCQGVMGHKGEHWSYRQNGDLSIWKNGEDTEELPEGIASAWIPPGSKGYISPIDKIADHYRKFKKSTLVTDPDIIAGLEKEETPEFGASIDRPLTKEEVDKLEGSGRLD